jgi:hypothetical protein
VSWSRVGLGWLYSTVRGLPLPDAYPRKSGRLETAVCWLAGCLMVRVSSLRYRLLPFNELASTWMHRNAEGIRHSWGFGTLGNEDRNA